MHAGDVCKVNLLEATLAQTGPNPHFVLNDFQTNSMWENSKLSPRAQKTTHIHVSPRV